MSIVERVRADGTRTFLVRPHVDGRRLKAQTFTDEDAAKDYHRLMQAKGRRGIYTDEPCDAYVRRWLREHTIVKSGPTRNKQKKLATLQTYENDLQPFVSEFQGRGLGDVNRREAKAFARRHPRSASVARNVYADAIDDELVRFNPFADLRMPQSRGRRDHDPLREHEAHDLADTALAIHGPGYGPMVAGFVLWTFYQGHRLDEGLHQEWSEIHPAKGEVFVRKAKFDKPRTIALFPEAWDAIQQMPSRQENGRLVLGKRGRPYGTESGFYWAWDPVRKAFWAKLSQRRRDEVVDLDWHSLRHACGFHLHVTLKWSAEDAGFQLGHEGPDQIKLLYGHYASGALERIKAQVGGRTPPQTLRRSA